MKKLVVVTVAALSLSCGEPPKAPEKTPAQLVEQAKQALNERTLEGILKKIPPGTPGREKAEARLAAFRAEEEAKARAAAEARADDDRLAEKGKALQAKLAKGHPMMKPGVGGELMRFAVASVSVPMAAWEPLSPEDCFSIALFARSTIPDLRRNPDRYLADIGIPTTAPVYDKLRSNIAGVCDDCFEVMLVTVKDRTAVTLERVALRGDGAWTMDPRSSGEKWSGVEKHQRALIAKTAPSPAPSTATRDPAPAPKG